MARGSNSRNHHWWPVALQQYWADRREELAWIEPDGTIEKKKPKNKKIGYKAHGHTISKGTLWESNFENEFDVDNETHRIVSAAINLKPYGRTPSEFIALLNLLRKKDRTLAEMCKFYQLDEKIHRDLLLFLYSLLIRSPANRSQYERYPEKFGLPSNEEVGKANMSQDYHTAGHLDF